MPDVRECLAHDVIHRSLARSRSFRAARGARSSFVVRRSRAVPRPCHGRRRRRAAPHRATPCRVTPRVRARLYAFTLVFHAAPHLLWCAGLPPRGSNRFFLVSFFTFFFVFFYMPDFVTLPRCVCARARGERERESCFIFIFFVH